MPSHNGASLAQSLPGELAVQDKQRPGDAGRLKRPWLTGDAPGYTPPCPILAGVLEWDRALHTALGRGS